MIREPHFHQFALAELLPFFEQFPTQYLSGERNIKLAYRHLVQPESAVRKLMILVNGRAENMLKWTELAYDFYQQVYDAVSYTHLKYLTTLPLFLHHHKKAHKNPPFDKITKCQDFLLLT